MIRRKRSRSSVPTRSVLAMAADTASSAPPTTTRRTSPGCRRIGKEDSGPGAVWAWRLGPAGVGACPRSATVLMATPGSWSDRRRRRWDGPVEPGHGPHARAGRTAPRLRRASFRCAGGWRPRWQAPCGDRTDGGVNARPVEGQSFVLATGRASPGETLTRPGSSVDAAVLRLGPWPITPTPQLGRAPPSLADGTRSRPRVWSRPTARPGPWTGSTWLPRPAASSRSSAPTAPARRPRFLTLTRHAADIPGSRETHGTVGAGGREAA